MKNKAEKNFTNRIISKTLSIIIACIIVISMLPACGAGIPENESTQQSALVSPEEVAATPIPAPSPVVKADTVDITPASTPGQFGKPNIYFFVLDEYSSFDMLSKYYGYDNNIFNDFLEMEGFNISRVSYSTDFQTEHCFCDLLNLNYISRYYSNSKCYKAITKAELFKALSGLGYSQFQLSTSSNCFKGIVSLSSKAGKKAFNSIITEKKGTGNAAVPDAVLELLASQPLSAGFKGDPAELTQWGFYPSDYIRKTSAYKKSSYRSYSNRVLSIFDYFENPSNYPVTSPRVTYCHFTATHVPFSFGEFGEIIPSKEARNWRDTNIYLNQYKFVTRHMMAAISTIKANDPDSIIIVMSDHGIRYHADCSKKHKFVITDKDSCRIMNAVYIKGQKYDIEGFSGINTLRYIMSLYDGVDYPAIQDPITPGSPDCLKGIIPRSRHK